MATVYPVPAETKPESGSSTGKPARTQLFTRLLFSLGAVLFLLIGLGIRLYDLKDPPLDFHPTRQLRGALIARGMYYKMLPDPDPEMRKLAIAFGNSTGQYEPSILEKIAATTYVWMGSEQVWVARVYSSIFWIIGGIALFALARRMTSPGAGLVALGYYLFLPFAVEASRSFQPDPGMVMGILLAVYALYRWSETKSWKWALAAGLLAGLAVLVKVVAGYILGAAAAAVVLYTLGLRRFWRSPQVYAMAALMVAPAAVYYLGSRQGRAGEYFEGWTISLSHLLLDPAFYVRWLSFVQNLMGLTVILLALVGMAISRPRNRALLAGLWAGYGIYGLFLPYQMYTHNYYHLQLIPILGLSLAPIAQLVLDRLAEQGRVWKVIFAGVAIIAVVFPVWVARSTLKSVDNRAEPEHWQRIGALLPTDGKILALTQDYGYPLMYYGWRKVTLWPNRGERSLAELRGSGKTFEEYFSKRAEGKDYFLVTAFNQLDDQPDLKDELYNHYTVTSKGSGYIIFDLTRPLTASSP